MDGTRPVSESVVFYLRTFVSMALEGRRFPSISRRRRSGSGSGGNNIPATLERFVSRNVNEVEETVEEIVFEAIRERRGESEEEIRTTRLVLRLCLIAACGGHGQSLRRRVARRTVEGTMRDAVARVTETYAAAYDEGAIVAPAETLIRDSEDVERRAYDDEEKRDGAGPTMRKLFEWSGVNASTYSFDHKTLEDLVATG